MFSGASSAARRSSGTVSVAHTSSAESNTVVNCTQYR